VVWMGIHGSPAERCDDHYYGTVVNDPFLVPTTARMVGQRGLMTCPGVAPVQVPSSCKGSPLTMTAR
jgi:hypothetical protein